MTQTARTIAPSRVGRDPSLYDTIAELSYGATRSVAAFDGVVAPTTVACPPATTGRIERTADELRRFHRTALDVFTASMRDEAAPEVARAFLDHLPPLFGWEHHRSLRLDRLRPPMFFRTDQSAGGLVLEAQCPGSLWGVHEILAEAHACGSGASPAPLSQRFTDALQELHRAAPRIHHLLDNSSHPAGEQFFIQRARDAGARYFGYDTPLRPHECNTVRAHDFLSLLTENFAAERLERYADGEQLYDLPPVAIFDQKLLLALPFWPTTREHFDDRCRALFPPTSVLEPGGLILASGEPISIERFAALPRRDRGYFLKYAGSDIARNWGSRSVFHLGKQSRDACLELLQGALAAYDQGERWIVQEEVPSYATTDYVERSGATATGEFHAKWSVFCGPSGAMGVLVMYERFYKVHGSTETVVTVADLHPEASA